MKTCSKCGIEKEKSEYLSRKGYCKECGKEMCRKYKETNKEKIALYNKKYKLEKKEQISEYNKKYNKENREKIQQRQTKTHKERRKTDLNFRLTINMRNRFKKFFNGKFGKMNDTTGCSMENFKRWMEYSFKDGMTFENYGSIWHIDHVIPCSLFDFSDDSQKKICFNWKNMRPLFATENISRGNKVELRDILFHELKTKILGIQI